MKIEITRIAANEGMEAMILIKAQDDLGHRGECYIPEGIYSKYGETYFKKHTCLKYAEETGSWRAYISGISSCFPSGNRIRTERTLYTGDDTAILYKGVESFILYRNDKPVTKLRWVYGKVIDITETFVLLETVIDGNIMKICLYPDEIIDIKDTMPIGFDKENIVRLCER